MSLEPGGAVTSHPAVPSQPAGNGPPTVTGQPAGSAGGVALAEPAVSCDGVTYRFGDHVAVDDVDLTIGPGETFGLLGPNGAGRTTTIRMLVTLLKPMAGRISVLGADAAAQPMRVRRMIGYVPQLLSADGSLTGRENVELFARLFDVPRSGRTQRVVLAKLMVTPTPRSALITGKAFAAGLRSLVQAVVIVVLAALLGVALTDNPLKLLATACVVVLGSAFFSCLSMSIAGVALSRDRLMGIGQAITMPLFFSSNALYPTRLMPGWLQAISKVNPLSYEVDALRGLLIGVPTNLGLDVSVLVAAAVAGVVVASVLLPRLAK